MIRSVRPTVLVLFLVLIPAIRAGQKPAVAWETSLRLFEQAVTKANYAEANRHIDIALIQAAKFGDMDDRYFTTLDKAADYFYMVGIASKAELNAGRMVRILEKKNGVGDLSLTKPLGILASISNGQHKYALSLAYYKRILAIQEKGIGPNSLQVGDTWHKIGAVHLESRQYSEAQKAFARALELHEAVKKTEVLSYVLDLFGLADVYEAQKRYDAAEDSYAKALRLEEEVFGVEARPLAAVLKMHAQMLRRTGRTAEADQMDARANAIIVKTAKNKS